MRRARRFSSASAGLKVDYRSVWETRPRREARCIEEDADCGRTGPPQRGAATGPMGGTAASSSIPVPPRLHATGPGPRPRHGVAAPAGRRAASACPPSVRTAAGGHDFLAARARPGRAPCELARRADRRRETSASYVERFLVPTPRQATSSSSTSVGSHGASPRRLAIHAVRRTASFSARRLARPEPHRVMLFSELEHWLQQAARPNRRCRLQRPRPDPDRSHSDAQFSLAPGPGRKHQLRPALRLFWTAPAVDAAECPKD